MGGIQAAVQDEVAGWPGVTAVPHRFGGVEFRLGRVELGHIHGDYLADLPFPKAVPTSWSPQGGQARIMCCPSRAG